VTLYARSDDSGTQEAFFGKVCGVSGAKGTLSGNSLDSSKFTTFGSNQEIVAALGKNADGLGFTAHALTTISSNSLLLNGIPMQNPNTGLIVTAQKDTVKAMAQNDLTQTKGQYYGSRPLVYVTVDQPSGAAKSFIDFVLDPQNNKDITTASGYFSIYFNN